MQMDNQRRQQQQNKLVLCFVSKYEKFSYNNMNNGV